MTLFTSFVIGFIASYFATFLFEKFNKRRNKNLIKEATLTGTWTQHTYKSYPSDELTTDLVTCQHNPKTNEVKGEIKRIKPIDQNHKIWEFTGKFEKDILYLIYWPKSLKTFSFGTIVMTFNEVERKFQGTFIKTASKISSGNEIKYSKVEKSLIEVPISWSQVL